MRNCTAEEVLPANLAEHRAVKAWSQLEPERIEPDTIVVLRLTRKKSAVYRMTGVGANGGAIVAKRCRTTTASVERIIYEMVLSRLSLPTLGYYGFVPEPGGEFCWLFLEDAGAHEYSPDNAEHRALAGRCLAAVHRVARVAGLQAQLPDRGLTHYLQRLRSSRAALLQRISNPVLAAADLALLQTVMAQFDLIEANWAEMERFSNGVPPTLVHGDFVIRNLRIRPGANPDAVSRLLVYDWEMAGLGFPATDLAQVDRCARADLEAYYAVARQDFPQLDFRDIQRLANYGNLLRVVDEIYWATLFMVRDTYKTLLKPLRMIGHYETQLAASLQAVNWSAPAGWKRALRTGLTPLRSNDKLSNMRTTPTLIEAPPERLSGHRAVKAWAALNPERVKPESIEVLKFKRIESKSAVYRLNGVAPDGSAVVAKRCLAVTASVERVIYEELLPQLPLPAVRYYGHVDEPGGEFCWLFLENAGGLRYSPRDAGHRSIAARWLAAIQAAAVGVGLETRLPPRDADYYLGLLRSTRDRLGQHFSNPELSAADVRTLRNLSSQLDVIEAHWPDLRDACDGLPPTLVHGDFVAKNVRLRADLDGPAFLVFDWEYAGWGLPATDLSQFVGRSVSPDLEVYSALVNGPLRAYRGRAARMAECGRFFRLIVKINWPSLALTFEPYPWLEKPMSYLKIYEPRLAEAVRALNWSNHD